MDRPVKERLIGAIVLVTVAWLLIPVFLDAPSTTPASEDAWVTLPRAEDGETPSVPTRRETIVLQQPESQAPVDDVPVANLPAPLSASATSGVQIDGAQDLNTPTQAREDDSSESASTVEPDAQDVAPVVIQEQPQADAITVAAAEAIEQTPQPVDVSPQAVVTSPTDSDAQMWAVQLGSFSNEANAQRLAAQYRADGLLAFVSKVEQGGRTLHRVRIGPDSDRSISDAIVVRLTEAGQTARTVPHP